MSELDQYDYHLPEELIAQHPLARRSDARLLVVNRARGTFEHAHVRDLSEFVRGGDSLVLNDTKVVPARLVGFREQTGGRWSGLFLGADQEQGYWKLLAKTRGKARPGEQIVLIDREGRQAASLILLARLNEGAWAARPDPPGAALEILSRVGRVPLPAYIRGGEMVEADLATYQTVFAEKAGAVAAPTAGLHFTPELLSQLANQDVPAFRVTLHVGVGTFRPISTPRIADHPMHAEWGTIDETTAQTLRERRAAGGRTIAVGTTSVRVLETAAAGGSLSAWQGDTSLFIRPPYEFRAVDALLTNFHLPKSTLLILVRTFGGDELLRRAYDEAIRERYRFFSYGDAMLIV